MAPTRPSGEQIKDASIGIADLSATGIPSSSTFFRGDNTWAEITGGSGLSQAQVLARVSFRI